MDGKFERRHGSFGGGVLMQPCDPNLHEDCARSAIDYVRLAEAANGSIPRPVGLSYIWGAALDEFNRMRPDVRIINLETSITRSEDYERKGINYRMSPENADCLKAAAIDCCVLSNNHVLDWGSRGLLDTLATLKRVQIRTAGAGRNLGDAGSPAVLDIAGKGRVLLFSLADVTSGVPRRWCATSERPGVNPSVKSPRMTPYGSLMPSCVLMGRVIWSLFLSIGGRTGATIFQKSNAVLRTR